MFSSGVHGPPNVSALLQFSCGHALDHYVPAMRVSTGQQKPSAIDRSMSSWEERLKALGCHRKVCNHEESLWAGLLKATSEVTEG
jgi:hypothetical protein